jgi:hypothetical protein
LKDTSGFYDASENCLFISDSVPQSRLPHKQCGVRGGDEFDCGCLLSLATALLDKTQHETIMSKPHGLNRAGGYLLQSSKSLNSHCGERGHSFFQSCTLARNILHIRSIRFHYIAALVYPLPGCPIRPFPNTARKVSTASMRPIIYLTLTDCCLLDLA